MRRFNALHIENKSKINNPFHKLLNDHFPEVALTSICSETELITAIKKNAPDILFVEGNFKRIEQIDWIFKQKNRKFEIIIITNKKMKLAESIKSEAIDLLVGPAKIEAVKEALDKVFEKSTGNGSSRRYNEYRLKPDAHELKILGVATAKGYELIQISDIIRCEASNNYTYFYLLDGSRFLVSKTLLYFERQLSGHFFFRAHQSHLINLRMVKSYRTGDGGKLVLANGESIDVSRRKKTELLNAMSTFAIMSA